MALHFIGVRGEQREAASRIWGEPDHVWERATWSLMGEIAADDTVILGAHAFLVPKKWRSRPLTAHAGGCVK